MLKWLGTACVLSIMLIVQACAPKSQMDCGFVQNVYGERISWQTESAVQMRLHESVPDSMIPAILAAAETWDRQAGRKVLEIVAEPRVKGPANPHKDGVNVIYLLDSWESNRSSEQGRTSIYWIGDLIKEADVRLNAADFGFYWRGDTLTRANKNERSSMAPVNIEALVLHEFGHVLGLKHNDTGGSVMATYLASGDDRVRLAAVDESSLKCEY